MLKPKTTIIELSPPTRIPRSYPPRLLLRGYSQWLHKQKPSPPFQFIQGQWCLVPDKQRIWVNGQELLTQHTLQDGDYVVVDHIFNKICGLYQADPIAHYKEKFDHPDEVVTLKITHQLTKFVVIDENGISLDGGKNFALWGEIVKIEADPGFNWRVKIFVSKDGKKKLSSKLERLRAVELGVLLQWILILAPFLPSIEITGSFQPFDWDAHYVFALQKWIIPAQENQLQLPDTTGNILQIIDPSERGTRKTLNLILVFALVAMGIILYKPSDFSLRSVGGVILSAGFITMIYIVFFAVTNPIYRLASWLVNRID